MTENQNSYKIPDSLAKAWFQNLCGDEECQQYRLTAAIAVLTGKTIHKELADKINQGS